MERFFNNLNLDSHNKGFKCTKQLNQVFDVTCFDHNYRVDISTSNQSHLCKVWQANGKDETFNQMGVVLSRIAFITYFVGQLKIIFCFKKHNRNPDLHRDYPVSAYGTFSEKLTF